MNKILFLVLALCVSVHPICAHESVGTPNNVINAESLTDAHITGHVIDKGT